MTMSRFGAGVLTLAIGVCAAGTLAARPTSVPFTARGHGTLTPAPDGTLQLTGSGKATHLGRYTVSGVQTFFPGMPPTFVGEVTMVAANGDELEVTVTGIVTSPPPNPAGEGWYEITGGTGRFEGASGDGSFSAGPSGTRFDGFILLQHDPQGH